MIDAVKPPCAQNELICFSQIYRVTQCVAGLWAGLGVTRFFCLLSPAQEKTQKRMDYTLGRKINTGIELCLQPGGPSFRPACQSRLAKRTEMRRPGCLFTLEIICADLIKVICLNNEQCIYGWM